MHSFLLGIGCSFQNACAQLVHHFHEEVKQDVEFHNIMLMTYLKCQERKRDLDRGKDTVVQIDEGKDRAVQVEECEYAVLCIKLGKQFSFRHIQHSDLAFFSISSRAICDNEYLKVMPTTVPLFCLNFKGR